MICTKVSYHSIADAKGHQQGLIEKGNDSKIYHCKKCGKYHIARRKSESNKKIYTVDNRPKQVFQPDFERQLNEGVCIVKSNK